MNSISNSSDPTFNRFHQLTHWDEETSTKEETKQYVLGYYNYDSEESRASEYHITKVISVSHSSSTKYLTFNNKQIVLYDSLASEKGRGYSSKKVTKAEKVEDKLSQIILREEEGCRSREIEDEIFYNKQIIVNNSQKKDRSDAKILSKFINALYDGKKAEIYKELDLLLNHKTNKEILRKALNNEYSFLIGLLVDKGLNDIANILIEFSHKVESSSIDLIKNTEKSVLGLNNIPLSSQAEKDFLELLISLPQVKKYKQHIRDMVLTYQLFTNETNLFAYLLSIKDKSFIKQFLKEMLREGLPHNSSQLNIVVSALMKHGEKKYKTIFIERTEHLRKIAVLKKEHFNIENKNTDIIDWNVWTSEEIVTALSEPSVVMPLTFNEIKEWLQNPSEETPIDKLNEKMQSWVSFQIVSEINNKKRDKIFHKFVEIGNILYRSQNYHGANLISQALVSPAVKKILTKEQLSDPFYLNITEIAQEPEYTYINIKKKSALSAITPKFLNDFAKEYAYFTDKKVKLDLLSIKDLSPFAEKLTSFQYSQYANISLVEKNAIHYFSNLNAISCSEVEKLAAFTNKSAKEVPMDEFSFERFNAGDIVEMAKYNFQKEGNLSILIELVNSGLFNGENKKKYKDFLNELSIGLQDIVELKSKATEFRKTMGL